METLKFKYRFDADKNLSKMIETSTSELPRKYHGSDARYIAANQSLIQ